MAVFARFTRNRKTVFVCIAGALFFCVWLVVPKQTPRRRVVTYDQQINESFPNSALFKLKEVTESDVGLWQGKFYSSLASAIKSQSKSLAEWKALTLYTLYNQSHLSHINQITLPGNEPKQTVKSTSQNHLLQFLETASCQPITPDVVIYNRIFKTGSETIGAFLHLAAAMMNYSYSKGKYGRVPFDKKFRFEFPK